MTNLLMQAEYTTDTSSCGGRMINAEVVTTRGGAGNFSVITENERATGVTKTRKFFIKIADSLNPLVLAAAVWLSKPSKLTDSRSYIVAGTQRDQQGAIASRKYATGLLNAGVTAGDLVVVVDFETGSGADLVVQAGDKIAVLEGSTINSDLIASTVTWAGDTATITLTTPLLNNFTTAAFVASCIIGTAHANPKVDNIAKAFSTSTFNDTAFPILVNNLATIEETIALTISGATTFTVLSDKRGTLASGSTTTDYAPVNADFALDYFTIPAAGWGGTHTVGETMIFQVHPAAIPFFIIQQTFAGAAAGVADEVYPICRIER